MPLHLPFNFPYFYNNRNYRRPQSYYPNMNNYQKQNIVQDNSNHNIQNDIRNNNQNESKKYTEDSVIDNPSETSEYFFEVFGLKLHFDDVLIICILFFLYKEEVQDYDLFLCLILLLIS